MGVRKKKRNKIIVDGRLFVWFVEYDDEYHRVLHVCSEDKKFIVRFLWTTKPGNGHLVVIGCEFPRASGTGGIWRRFLCPALCAVNQDVTPAVVRRLIDWCNSEGPIIEVDYAERPLPLGGLCVACGARLGGMIPINSNSCHRCGHTIEERVTTQ